MKQSQQSDNLPQVLKDEEFGIFIDFVTDGLWKNNRFLADLVGVHEETISAWKKRPEALKAKRIATKDALRKWKHQGDPEKQLKEKGMDFDPDKLDVSMKVEVIGLEDLQ